MVSGAAPDLNSRAFSADFCVEAFPVVLAGRAACAETKTLSTTLKEICYYFLF
jgi:hypothetical protein